jgi:hypothetical protein
MISHNTEVRGQQLCSDRLRPHGAAFFSSLASQGVAPCDVLVGLSIQPSLPTYVSQGSSASKPPPPEQVHQPNPRAVERLVRSWDLVIGNAPTEEEEEGLQGVLKRLRRNGHQLERGKGGYKYSQGSLCPPGLWLGAARELASGSMED